MFAIMSNLQTSDKSKVISYSKELRPNIIWDIVKWVGGALMPTGILSGFFYYLTAISLNWIIVLGIFATSLLFMAVSFYFGKNQKANLADESKFDSQSLTEIKPARTILRLQFNPNNVLPLALEVENIWRWYTLQQFLVSYDKKMKQKESVVANTTVFVMFTNPIPLKQVKINCSGALPIFEVKDAGERHAIIIFDGGLSGLVIDIEAIY